MKFLQLSMHKILVYLSRILSLIEDDIREKLHQNFMYGKLKKINLIFRSCYLVLKKSPINMIILLLIFVTNNNLTFGNSSVKNWAKFFYEQNIKLSIKIIIKCSRRWEAPPLISAGLVIPPSPPVPPRPGLSFLRCAIKKKCIY